MTQAELARRVGITQPAVSKLVLGETANSRFIHKIARELSTTAEWLTGEVDELPEADEVTREEREWIDLLRGLAPSDRVAVMTLTRSLATSAASPRLQAPKLEYRGK